MNDQIRSADEKNHSSDGGAPADIMAVDLGPKQYDGAENLKNLWWQIAVLLVVCALLVYTNASFNEEWDKFNMLPEARPVATTYSIKPSGLRAAYKLAEETGKPIAIWEKPYRQLSSEKGMLVLIAPTESLAPFAIDQILNWVKEGNDLVYFDDLTFEATNQIVDKLGVKVKVIDAAAIKAPYIDVKPAGDFKELAHVQQLRLASNSRMTGGKPLASDEKGALITVIDFGKGRVLLGSAPGVLANSTIAKKEFWGNFQLISNWLNTARGTIFFDEYAHGFSGGTNIFVYLSRGPVGLIVVQIVIILLIAIMSEWQRFGAARSLDSGRKISNLEFINGLSNAYRRARANPAVLEILFHAFRNKLSRTLAVSPHEPLEKLKEAWAQSRFKDASDLDTLLKQYEAYMQRREVSDIELKTMIDSCDKISETTQDSLTSRTLIGAVGSAELTEKS